MKRILPAVAGFESIGKESRTKQCVQPIEAGKGKGMDPPSELTERSIVLLTPGFYPNKICVRLSIYKILSKQMCIGLSLSVC